MTIYISLIRGINVGGKNILMNELREIYSSLGFDGVKSYIQSGNIIFKSADQNCKGLEEEIEYEILKSHHQVVVVIRTLDEFRRVIYNNPYQAEDPVKTFVTFLKETPDGNPIDAIKGKKGNSERFHINDREIYLHLPNGYGRTRLNNNFMERQFNQKATTRNLRTVNRLYELAKE